jgi:hypothetical protein
LPKLPQCCKNGGLFLFLFPKEVTWTVSQGA